MESLVLAPETSSPAAARHFVQATLRHYPPEVVSELELLATELVTNVVLHARTSMTIRIVEHRSGIRVEVQDASSEAPVIRRYGERAATGRGLILVERLADSWGCDDVANGKVVWFEVNAARWADASVTGAME